MYGSQTTVAIEGVGLRFTTGEQQLKWTKSGSSSRIWCNQEQLALFPGHSDLQYLIACSMQIWKGKEGWFPTKNLPDVIARDQISQAFLLSVFTSDQILEVGMARERG